MEIKELIDIYLNKDMRAVNKYHAYLKEHKDNVQNAFDWIVKNLGNYIFTYIPMADYRKLNYRKLIRDHDSSKYDMEEFVPYALYFYGEEKTDDIKQSFNVAWLTHIHKNPHHWQHWVLINDDEGEECLEIPFEYIVEMICDWWSFSWKKGNLYEIFDWYDEHKDHMKINEQSRKRIEDILKAIREKLDSRKL